MECACYFADGTRSVPATFCTESLLHDQVDRPLGGTVQRLFNTIVSTQSYPFVGPDLLGCV
jgi:hypothetical protein